MATQETALRVQLNQPYSPSEAQPNPQIPETGQYTYIYNSTTGLQGEMDVDVSAIGHAFARGVDEGKVQASNQVLWDAHLNRTGLAQHWNCKRSPQNKSLHYKPTSELGKGYTSYNWGKKGASYTAFTIMILPQ